MSTTQQDGATLETSPEDPEGASREKVAFPRLSSSQLEKLRPYGIVEDAEPEQLLFEEGDAHFDFFVVLEGRVEITERSSGDKETVTVHEAGEFTGDIDLLSPRSTLVTGRVQAPGARLLRLLRLSPDCLRELVAHEPALSDVLLRAFLMRRTLLEGADEAGVRIIGSRYAPDTHRLKEFVQRNDLRAFSVHVDLNDIFQTLRIIAIVFLGLHLFTLGSLC